MAKSFESVRQELSRIAKSAKIHRPKPIQPVKLNQFIAPRTTKNQDHRPVVKVESPPKKVEAVESRISLSRVVADCAHRWFLDTLKEAKRGDLPSQVLVGQMYCSGYGVPRNPEKGHAWMSRASRSRYSIRQLSGKPPGYRASDSDSSELENKSTP